MLMETISAARTTYVLMQQNEMRGLKTISRAVR